MQRIAATVFLAAAVLFSHSAVAGSLRTVSIATLPDALIVRDVRWAGMSDVFMSAGREGVFRMNVTTPARSSRVMTVADRAAFPSAGLLAASQNHLFVASQVGRSIGWFPLNGPRRVARRSLLAVMDVDARGDRAAVLGADSGPLQGLARDGVIAWTGSFASDLRDLQPLMTGRSKPGGKDMARCSILELGAIRFMRDGSIVVAPGVEPGVYRYDAAGKLIQTWDTGSFGIVDDCTLAEDELLLIARDFEERIRWYAARTIVDDVLPLAEGAALLLRRVDKGTTRWDLLILPYRGKTERLPLSVSMPSPRAHARGDVRGDDVVLLLFEDPLPRQKPVNSPKLAVLKIVP